MSCLFKSLEVTGYQDIIKEDNDILNFLALGKIVLTEGETFTTQTGNYETALVILSGMATISSEQEKWGNLGGRSDVFDGKATVVYIPYQSEYLVIAETTFLQIAVCKVKAENKFSPFVIRPNDITVNLRGKDTWIREVHDIITENGDGRVHRMVLGETYNETGNWSSYPPHKHDGEFYPEEPNFEEVYHYQFQPEQGFGIQMHYTKDQSIDQAYIIRNGDSYAIEKGYHPISAAGGYRLYYLWFMAGDTGRNLKPYDEPDHIWLK
ncbi:5-deoxy-glucuronate isomerase [Fictibacillus sp. S7]|nr:5-deoxy-glucuronate isomerase [Fictibacillus sp. S7]